METPQISGLLLSLLSCWAVVTVGWIVLLIYRGTLETREDDQLFLASGEEHIAAEQRALVSRVIKLGRPILILGIASGTLLVLSIAVWLWQGFRSF